ncbi:MAG: hypothetical protein AB7E55_36330, partial [Pigmentiphaga sp.]
MAVTACRHGAQPESPAAPPAPTRHLALVATGFEPFDHHRCDAGPGHAEHETTAETMCVRRCDQQHRALPQRAG